MSDIIERLHTAASENAEDGSLMHEAATEIERLRLELQRWHLYDKQRGMETLATMDGFHNGPSK